MQHSFLPANHPSPNCSTGNKLMHLLHCVGFTTDHFQLSMSSSSLFWQILNLESLSWMNSKNLKRQRRQVTSSFFYAVWSLALTWTRTQGSYAVLQLIFGLTHSHLSLWLDLIDVSWLEFCEIDNFLGRFTQIQLWSTHSFESASLLEAAFSTAY